MRITAPIWGAGQGQSQLQCPQALAPTCGHDLGSVGLFSKQARSQDRRVIDDPVVHHKACFLVEGCGGRGSRQKLRLEGTELDNPFSPTSPDQLPLGLILDGGVDRGSRGKMAPCAPCLVGKEMTTEENRTSCPAPRLRVCLHACSHDSWGFSGP